MSQAPQPTVIRVRPEPNVYTILLLIAVIVLVIAVAMAYWKLTSPVPTGYGMSVGQLFEAFQPPAH